MNIIKKLLTKIVKQTFKEVNLLNANKPNGQCYVNLHNFCIIFSC